MKLLGGFAVLLVVVGAWEARPVAAHGCGCGHHVPTPPVYGGPRDTLGGPNTPGRDAPTGGPPAPGSASPAAPSDPSQPMPSGPHDAPATMSSWEQAIGGWEMWWGFNRTAYLDLRQALLTSSPLTGSDEFYLGRGGRQPLADRALTDAVLRLQVAPALWSAVEGDPDDEVRGAAMVALAKLAGVHTEAERRDMRELFERLLVHPDQAVVECALVALGLSGTPESAVTLCEIAADTPIGSGLLARESVPGRTRALAALSLGLAGSRCTQPELERHIVATLARVLEEERAGAADLAVACVTSLGLTRLPDADPPLLERERGARPPETSREAQIRFLCEKLDDPSLREVVRAHVPKALGALLTGVDDPQKEVVAEAMLDLLERRRRVERLVRHGLVFGLGRIGDSDADPIDVRIREALRGALRDGQMFQQQIALVALALVSGRGGAGEGDAFLGARETRAFLLRQLDRGKSRARPWAALALGLQDYHEVESGRAPSSASASALRSRLADARSPSDVGALCTALGLSGDHAAGPLLLEVLQEASGEEPRAHAALALGLLGERAAIPELRATVERSSYRPTLLREASIALALLGDEQVVDLLTGKLRESDSDFARTACIHALGYVGDERAVGLLIELLADRERSSEARRYAAVALGMVAERESEPWTSLFAHHVNYAAMTETLVSGRGAGILNRR